jgi:aspartate/methionine/tyrosine aminotransferase
MTLTQRATFVPFAMERWQSTWENRVRFNLSESGVHPLSIGELVDLAGIDLEALAATRLAYTQSNGTDELRAAIASLYPDAGPENVLVTVGSAEANFISSWTLVEPGDRVTVVAPTYMQTWGLAHNLGAAITPLWLDPNRDWEPDLDEIPAAIPEGTRLVVVTNPNNPTGQVLSEASREAIVARSEEVGAWLVSDEVYQGAERNGRTTRSFWGSRERVIVTNGLSKAYGLPGLRIGWIIAPSQLAEEIWSRHDYTVIAPSAASDMLARAALGVRQDLLTRTRSILNENWLLLKSGLEQWGPRLEWQEPDAGAICYVRYHDPIDSLQLAEQLRTDRSVLLVPGAHFGMPAYMRIGFGNERAELGEALAELNAGLVEAFGSTD